MGHPAEASPFVEFRCVRRRIGILIAGCVHDSVQFFATSRSKSWSKMASTSVVCGYRGTLILTEKVGRRRTVRPSGM